MHPDKFNSTMTMNHNLHLKQLLVGQLKWIIEEAGEHMETIKKEGLYFAQLIKPKNLNSQDVDNVIYQSRREFEKLCVILETQGISRPEKLSVFRFFTTLSFFEEKGKRLNSKNGR